MEFKWNGCPQSGAGAVHGLAVCHQTRRGRFILFHKVALFLCCVCVLGRKSRPDSELHLQPLEKKRSGFDEAKEASWGRLWLRLFHSDCLVMHLIVFTVLVCVVEPSVGVGGCQGM